MVAYPKWTRDELILACDLVRANGWRELREHDRRVAALSEHLRQLPLHEELTGDPRFRSAGSVSRKTTDIATRHPGYVGKQTRGSSLDQEVLNDFLAAPETMQRAAEEIRKLVRGGPGKLKELGFTVDIAFPDSVEVKEGRLLAARHYRRERNQGIRDAKIAAVLRAGRPLACEVCEFNFAESYGEHGSGYIECHHIVPLHASGETKTKPSDLILLCANCHRMIHRRAVWLRPDELRAILGRDDGPT
ncbi:HNH endonuclease [Nocardia asteroides]|uniref:HNH endonuclease n=1 Tax=Nocardia asteroides TaxID=1824 RepID=UPI001E31097F|nr:HNH endonuclease [Nocardia asteroides]UGT63779.1 HNH endonuclease [Nocardia asteroides]